MKHIISYSGGKDSLANAFLVKEKHGIKNMKMVFCETLAEDSDLYRFLIEGAAAIFEIEISGELSEKIYNVPSLKIGKDAERKNYLIGLHQLAMSEIAGYVALIDGRTIYEVFEAKNYAGNTRIAHCTTELKGRMFKKWVKENYKPDEITMYLGFDFAEPHRLKSARKNWAPIKVSSPLSDPPYLSGKQVFQIFEDNDIELPKMYKEGFSHNNCSGGCVKAGQGHWIKVLNKRPEIYAYWEHQQEKMFLKRESLRRPFLRVTVDKKLNYMSLKEFRQHIENKGRCDMFDVGGCDCFTVEEIDE